VATILELTYELAEQEDKIVKQCPKCNGYFISNEPLKDLDVNYFELVSYEDEVCIYCKAGEEMNPIEKPCACGCGKVITNAGYPIPKNHIYYSRKCSVKKFRDDRKNRNR